MTQPTTLEEALTQIRRLKLAGTRMHKHLKCTNHRLERLHPNHVYPSYVRCKRCDACKAHAAYENLKEELA